MELPPGPALEPLLDWDALSTLVNTFDGHTVLAVRDGEVQQHTPPMDSTATSNTVMQVPIQAEIAPWCVSGTMDGIYEDSRNDPNETSQSPPLESQDTGESNRLNFKKPVDDFEQDSQLAIMPTETVTYIPQRLYQPRGKTEREKYVHAANLSLPIVFYAEKPSELGIALEEILQKKSRRLSDRDDLVFEDGGQSISLRIEWPGYPSWNRQLSTRDYRKTRGPITKAKLAKNLATCIRRFTHEMATHRTMEVNSNPMWRISPHHIKFEDLILVSLNHVSQGSWQPQLRLRQQMRGRSSRT
ncbi:uncharacterized protein BJ212DRAFT_1393525 [Suillus subaureus]|uniref:Uncharacterized protein n=1 Tax=Suillus subaureus TaxID=48587 RepID=A0A9P7DVY2_9AGAM|nr:uncharacterized protein BJ212DRAFT_1393525 [Suillus subaureus]KAG1804518.1 hypothetical protein BJ212DRAFT_1393525 [Suillus subaureus]